MIRTVIVLMAIMLLVSKSVAEGYVNGSVGVGHFSIENKTMNDEQDTSYGGFIKLGFGYAFKHTILVGGALRWWNVDDEDDDDDGYEDELVQHILFHDFHFAGFSGGLDIQSFMPGFKRGPYIRYGRHCWIAQVYDYSHSTGSNECGDIWALGILGNRRASKEGAMLEVEYTRMGQVDATVLSIGVQY